MAYEAIIYEKANRIARITEPTGEAECPEYRT